MIHYHGTPISGNAVEAALVLKRRHMLDPAVFARVPLSSADSTNVARNCSLVTRWPVGYRPLSNEVRAAVIMERIECAPAAAFWDRSVGVQPSFALIQQTIEDSEEILKGLE